MTKLLKFLLTFFFFFIGKIKVTFNTLIECDDLLLRHEVLHKSYTWTYIMEFFLIVDVIYNYKAEFHVKSRVSDGKINRELA